MSSPTFSDNNEKPTNITFAGFWVRISSHLLDSLIIILVLLPISVFDVFVMEGDLGTFSYFKTIDQQIVADTTEESDDGSIKTFQRIIQTREDYQGRLAKVQIEKTVTRNANSTTTYTFSKALEADPDWGGKYSTYYQIGMMLLIIGYFPVMWSSSYQCTLGGKIMKLQVTDIKGNRITVLRALGRLAAVIPSSIILIGFYTILFTKKKQGLHDIIAKTLVLRKHP